eukprot:jgi/Tetstr1/429717/TSEL_019612.t1
MSKPGWAQLMWIIILVCALVVWDSGCSALYTASVQPSFVPSAGEEQELKIHITDGAGVGVPRHDLQAVHERPLHAMVLSGDWRTFAHVHPEDFEQQLEENLAGVFSLRLRFPEPGVYTLMLEFAVPERSVSQELQVVDLTVNVTVGGGQASELDQASLQEQLMGRGSEKLVSSQMSEMLRVSDFSSVYNARLEVNAGKPAFVGSCVPLELTLTTAMGVPITDLQPYLGAAAHVAVVHESMDHSLVTHTHAKAETDAVRLYASTTTDACIADVMNMTRPPDRFGSKVVAFVRFSRAGHYAVVAGMRRGAELLFFRFIVQAREVPVTVVTSPGAAVAGQAAEIRVDLGAEDVWGSTPTAKLAAAVVSDDLSVQQRLSLVMPTSGRLQDGLRAPITFPAAGKYVVRVHGVLVTSAQSIVVSGTKSIQVGGQPAMTATQPLAMSPVARWPGTDTNVAMVQVYEANGGQIELSAPDITAFYRITTPGARMIAMEVNFGAGVALAGRCTSLNVAGHVTVARQGSNLAVEEVQYLAALPYDRRGILRAEGYGASNQQDLFRRLCTPGSEPVQPTASDDQANSALAFVTFQAPGNYHVEFSFSTDAGVMSVRFAMHVCADTNDPISWSSSCAWPVQPAEGDRVLIPGGRHILLDVSTAALSEVLVHGRLEVARTPTPLTLRAGRLVVDLGGRFEAGTEASPLVDGRFVVELNRGGLAVLGEDLLYGSSLFAVGAGSVSLVGARASGQQGGLLALSEAAKAGAQQLVVAGASWTAGKELLVVEAVDSDTLYSEVVTVAAVRSSSGQVTLGAPLRHPYAVGANVILLSRSITVTSVQYADGGSSIRIAPPAANLLEEAFLDPLSRRLLAENNAGGDVGDGPLLMESHNATTGTRHLLHTDPTASLSEPTDFMVAGGGNGYSYFVVDASTDVLFDGVELSGLGRLGDGYAALSLLLPGGTCPFRKSAPLSRPPRIAIRSSAFHSLHNGCVRVTGLPSELTLQDTVCYGARGDGVLLSGDGTGGLCLAAPTATAAIEGCAVIDVQQVDDEGEVRLGTGRHIGGVSVREWTSTGELQLRVNRNLVAGSQGDGFALHAAKVTEFEGNTAHHNAHSGVLHSPNTHGGCALGAAVPVGAPAPLDLPASSLTAVGNGQQQVCAAMQDLGVFYAKAVRNATLPRQLPAVPPMRLLAPGVWTETLTIPVSSMPTLEYFRLEVPEDAAGVKLMVDQLEGNVDILLNPYGGAPCHEKFHGCQPEEGGWHDRSRMHGIFVGFAAQPGEITLLNLPLPAYATGPWVIAVGCDGCAFRVGLNITRCGDGWAGFPSSALQLSPALTGLHSPAEALELAGQNFTCVPVITAKVNEPVRNLTLAGAGASVFIKTQLPDFNSEVWTRVRRASHTGAPSSLHFRTLLRRLPTFSPGPATSAQTLTALYDTLTPAPDVREDQEVEDAEVPLDHFSQGMMFYRTGTYFTTLTQGVDNPTAAVPTTATVDIEVGTVSCETGQHVAAEPYFFPPHHVEDMVVAARVGPVKRACSMVMHSVEGGVYEGPQGPAERYMRVAGEMRGGRTSVYLIHVPPHSSRLHISLRTRQADTQLPASAEVYLRHGVPPIVIDVEDYVQWDYDRFTRLQGSEQLAEFDLPWYEVYERWGYWYVVVDWLAYNVEGSLLVEVDTGEMPACLGDPPCSDRGVCWSVDGQGLCQCQEGWAGDDCRHAADSEALVAASPQPVPPVEDSPCPALDLSGATAAAVASAVAAATADADAAATVLRSRVAELEGEVGALEAQLAATAQPEGDDSAAQAQPTATPTPTPQVSGSAPPEECGPHAVELQDCLAQSQRMQAHLSSLDELGGLVAVQAAAADLQAAQAAVASLSAELDVLQDGNSTSVNNLDEGLLKARERLAECSAESAQQRQVLIALGTVLGCLACACFGLLVLGFLRGRQARPSRFRRAKEHVSDFGSEVDIALDDSNALPRRLRGCPTCWGSSSLAVTSPTATRHHS